MAKAKRKRGLTPVKTKATSAAAKGLAISGEVKLNPPMTAKERKYLRQAMTGVNSIVAAFQFAEDPGVRSMASEIGLANSENSNRYVQAYRDGKEE